MRQVQMDVSILSAVHLNTMDGWALSGAGVQAPLHGVLETVWLHCDEAQRIGCLRGWKVVCWCRTQASSHNSQGVVVGSVNEADVSTATPVGSAVLCDWMHRGEGGFSQSCCSSIPTGTSKPPQERDAWCQLLAKWLKVSAIRERGGIHLRLSCPCSAPLPLPANLHQHAWLLDRQHMHTFWIQKNWAAYLLC